MPNGCQRPHPWGRGAEIEERRRWPCWWGLNAHSLAQQGQGSAGVQQAGIWFRNENAVILPEQENSRGPLRIHSLHRLMGFMRLRLGEFLDGRKSLIRPYEGKACTPLAFQIHPHRYLQTAALQIWVTTNQIKAASFFTYTRTNTDDYWRGQGRRVDRNLVKDLVPKQKREYMKAEVDQAPYV